jgi:hypothetical protein
MDWMSVPFVAIGICLFPPIGTALVAARKGRDGLVFFTLSFVWSCAFSGLLVFAVLFGLAGAFGDAKGAAGGGVGGACLAMLGCALFLLPTLCVAAMPGKPARASRAPSGDGTSSR